MFRNLIPVGRTLAQARVHSLRATNRPVRFFGAAANVSDFAAERMGNMGLAATDPVEDYRVLAKSDIWADALGDKKELRLLDVCSGTGRWVQAFAELVLKPRGLTAQVDCIDLCSDSLVHLENRFVQMPGVSNGKTHCMDAGKAASLGHSYDIASNMHGLYAVPREVLRDVVSSMVQVVAPGGRCIITLGSNDSFYVKYSAALVEAGVMPARYTSSNDIADVLTQLGVEFEVVDVPHIEKIDTQEGLDHFIQNESGGNTWTADDERTSKAVEAVGGSNVKALIDSYHKGNGIYHFEQTSQALVVRK